MSSIAGRHSHKTLVVGENVWLFGGVDCKGQSISDIWKSKDMINWEKIVDKTPYGSRNNIIHFNGKFWLIGGYENEYKNDIWSSFNGKDWSLETKTANFSPRANHTLYIKNNKLFLFGGRGEYLSSLGGSARSDIWSTTDGINWIEETKNTDVGRLGSAQITEYKNLLYLVGGGDSWYGYKSKTYFSEDGVNWEALKNIQQNVTKRERHQVFVLHGNLYAHGGFQFSNHSLIQKNDYWQFDGSEWRSIINIDFN